MEFERGHYGYPDVAMLSAEVRRLEVMTGHYSGLSWPQAISFEEMAEKGHSRAVDIMMVDIYFADMRQVPRHSFGTQLPEASGSKLAHEYIAYTRLVKHKGHENASAASHGEQRFSRAAAL